MPNETVTPKCSACFEAWGEADVCTCAPHDARLHEKHDPLPGEATALEALSAEKERLRKALEPFAKAAAHHEAFSGDRPVRSDGDVLVSHLRAARRALEGGE